MSEQNSKTVRRGVAYVDAQGLVRDARNDQIIGKKINETADTITYATQGVMRFEGLDASDISPVYMTPPTNSAPAENLPRITPDMLSIWQAYQARLTDDEPVYPSEMHRFQAELWAKFAAMMDGGEG